MPSRPIRLTARSRVGLAGLVGLFALGGCTTLTPEAQTAALIARAEAALGSATLKTLTVTGRGSGASVGQAYAPGTPWPALNLTALSRALNFETASFREEFIRSRSEPLGGGAVPPMGAGEARGVVLARENFAWDVAGNGILPTPAALPARVHDLWLTTPQGAIKAAAQSGARAGVRRDFLRRWDTLTFQRPGQFSATLVLEDNGLISRIESTVSNPVLGEMPVLTQFQDYRLHGSVLLPSRIVQDQGGYPTLDLQVTRAAADEAVEITVPDEVRAASERVSVEKVAEGVWFLGGGTHNSVAIELAAQIVLVELPQHAGRAQAVLKAANQLVPDKPALTIINTHHHFDHAGGLRAAIAGGRTIFTSTLAKPYFEAVMAPPSASPSAATDAAGGAPKTVFMAVDGKTVLRDALRTVEIHELLDSPHARGLLVVWLPEERLLIEADVYTPGAPVTPGTPAPAVPNPNHLNLVQNLDRLKLSPRLILPLHGRVVPAAELYAQVGRPPPP